MLLEVVAEGLERGSAAFCFRGGVEALAEHVVGGVDVDGLLGFLLEPFEGVAERGLVERGAGFVDQLLPRGFEAARARLSGRGVGLAGGAFGDGVGVDGAEQCAGELGERFAAGECGDLLGLVAGSISRSSRARRAASVVSVSSSRAEGRRRAAICRRRRWAGGRAGGIRSCRSRRRRRHRR